MSKKSERETKPVEETMLVDRGVIHDPSDVETSAVIERMVAEHQRPRPTSPEGIRARNCAWRGCEVAAEHLVPAGADPGIPDRQLEPPRARRAWTYLCGVHFDRLVEQDWDEDLAR